MFVSECVFFFCIVSCFTRWLGHANLSLNTKLAGHAGSFVLEKILKKKQWRINKRRRTIYRAQHILTAGPL